MAKTLAEEIFGGVSDFKGMGTGGDYKPASVPAGTANRIPRYHEAEQVDPTTVVIDDTPVTEKDLSSHF